MASQNHQLVSLFIFSLVLLALLINESKGDLPGANCFFAKPCGTVADCNSDLCKDLGRP
ncbi:hypothetical protein U1Q18_048152, partial [Sarracenia purpurea var. burkii]